MRAMPAPEKGATSLGKGHEPSYMILRYVTPGCRVRREAWKVMRMGELGGMGEVAMRCSAGAPQSQVDSVRMALGRVWGGAMGGEVMRARLPVKRGQQMRELQVQAAARIEPDGMARRLKMGWTGLRGLTAREERGEQGR